MKQVKHPVFGNFYERRGLTHDTRSVTDYINKHIDHGGIEKQVVNCREWIGKTLQLLADKGIMTQEDFRNLDYSFDDLQLVDEE